MQTELLIVDELSQYETEAITIIDPAIHCDNSAHALDACTLTINLTITRS